MSRILLTIDRIALQGFEPAERAAFIEGLRSELERTLADRQARTAWQSQRRPVLRLGGVAVEPGPASSRKLGSQIARSVTRRLKP